MDLRSALIWCILFVALIQLAHCWRDGRGVRAPGGRHDDGDWTRQSRNRQFRHRKRQALEDEGDLFEEEEEPPVTDDVQLEDEAALAENEAALEEDEGRYDPWRDNFDERFEDGSYSYGYSLPNGVTRYERSVRAADYDGYIVEGFFSQPRAFGSRVRYELQCYRADINGYRLLAIEYVARSPTVRRGIEPNVDCLANDDR